MDPAAAAAQHQQQQQHQQPSLQQQQQQPGVAPGPPAAAAAPAAPGVLPPLPLSPEGWHLLRAIDNLLSQIPADGSRLRPPPPQGPLGPMRRESPPGVCALCTV